MQIALRSTQTLDEFHSVIEPFLVPDADGKRDLDRLLDYVEKDKEAMWNLTAFYENQSSVAPRSALEAYSWLGEATEEAMDKTWRELVREILLAGE